jgi:hypothetical protein
MKRLLSFSLSFLISIVSFAQLKPIGSWTEHLPYQSGNSLDLNNNLIYAGTSTGLFTYNLGDNSIERFSTVNRLNDININSLAYSNTANALLVIYEDLNIDILGASNTINIPSIKDASLTNKSLNDIFLSGGFAYLSCGFGIVKLNLLRSEISETYQFAQGGGAIDVNATITDGSLIYAATAQGLFYADLSSNLLDFNNWKINPALGNNIIDLFSFQGQIHAVADRGASDSVFVVSNNSASPVNALSGKDYIDSDTHNGKILIASLSDLTVYDTQLQAITQFQPPLSNLQDVKFNDESIFILNNFDPLLLYDYQGNLLNIIKPEGPFEEQVFDIDVEEGVLWAVAGGYNQSYNNQFRSGRIYRFEDGSWTSYLEFSEPSLSGVFDVLSVNIKADNPDEVYFGTWGAGLVELRNEPPFKVYRDSNSSLNERTLWPGWVGVGGTAFDEEGNLWVVNTYTSTLLSARSPSGNWTQYNFPGIDEETAATEIKISQGGLIWLALPRNNEIIVADPESNQIGANAILFRQGEGLGDVPGIRGITMEFDLDNQLWVGTSDGIAVKFNPDNVFEESATERDFERILIDDGENVEILLGGTEITDIEIDGANRKWIATNGSGVYLLSEDGKEVINQFTTDNSPLFSDIILSIAIDDLSGEVYFATGSGLISYRSDVVAGNESFSNVKVFPNPVREDYRGPISIDGLIDQSTVKITDINGRLINEVESKGGRAIWDGNNFQGERVSTGVYLVFSSASSAQDNLRTAISKILFIR